MTELAAVEMVEAQAPDGADDEFEHRLKAAIDAELASEDLELPLLPTSAMEVFHLASDADADVGKVAGLIERDQKLATGVLRVANSAAYSPRVEIVTLRQAIMRLGLKSLCEIVLGTAFKATVFSDDRYMQPMERYWWRGIGSALWNKEIARLRRKNVETAYLCGLLHNVGEPMTLKIVSGLDEAPPFDHRLAAIVHSESPRVGAVLADLWELPEVVKTCISFHQDYAAAENYRDDVCSVRTASLLLDVMELNPEEPADLVIGDSAFQELNVYPDDLSTLLSQRSRLAVALEAF